MSLTCSGFVKFLEGYKVGDPQEKGRGRSGQRGMTTLERPALSAHKWIKSLRYTCCLMSAVGRPWAMGRQGAIEGLFCASISTYTRQPTRGFGQAD